MQTTIDPQIKALTSAIGETETGTSSPDAYKKRGASGEYGRYQFMPNTWSQWAKESGVSTPLEQSSIEEQNTVAYNKVRQWKEQGLSPAQIASKWNSGDENAYKNNHVGVNSQGVKFDTPTYAMKVSNAYNRLKGGQIQPSQSPTPEGQSNFFQDVGNSAGTLGHDLATAYGKGATGEINPASALLQGVGALGKGVGNLTNDVLTNLPVVGGIVKGAEGAVGKLAQGAVNTDAGQQALSAYQQFASEHPEMAGNIGAGLDIATAIPILKGVSVARGAVRGGINTALHGGEDAVLEAVSPRLTPKNMARAVAERGTEKKGLLGEVRLKPSPRDIQTANAVKENVPKFNPNKPLVNQIDSVQSVVNTMKKQLKQKVQELGNDRIYSYRELGSALRNIDVPDVIAADSYLTNLNNRLIGHALRIAKEKKGKVSNLLDARQEFDRLVKKQYPNIYSAVDRTSPLRETVKNIRNALTDFTVKNLPEGSGLKESLLTQHELINAIEAISEKATKGGTKEIGTNSLSRFGKRHPIMKGLVKSGVGMAVQGAGLGGIMKIME